MGLYVAKRVLTIGLILIVISVLIFFITQGLPGNVARLIARQFATPDVVAAVEAKLGLNDPLLTQYWRWASGILSGDLGQSLIMERPIGPMLREFGIVFAGIDVIGRWLTEVNVTSPTGIQEINRLDGVVLERQVLDAVERRHRALGG